MPTTLTTDKHNYHEDCLTVIRHLEGGEPPRLLLHVCCGPCGSFPLTLLAPHFHLTIYYANSNIYPEKEFQKRYKNLKKLVSGLKREYGFKIKVIKAKYEHEKYMEPLRAYAELPERGYRCKLCYEKRLREAFIYASKHGFPYVATTLTSSREKDSQLINKIGLGLEQEYQNVKYLPSDFKKGLGNRRRQELIARYELYVQKYCGCEYSKR